MSVWQFFLCKNTGNVHSQETHDKVICRRNCGKNCSNEISYEKLPDSTPKNHYDIKLINSCSYGIYLIWDEFKISQVVQLKNLIIFDFIDDSWQYCVYFQLSPAYGGGPAPSPGYTESRSGWPGGPTGPQSSYGAPGSPSNTSSAPVSQPSPQPSQPPSHSPGPGPGMPPSPQHQAHQGFPVSRPPPATTPNAHAPDAAVSRNFIKKPTSYYYGVILCLVWKVL